MTEPITITAIEALRRDSDIGFPIDKLLHKLKPFMRAYPYDIHGNMMPDHEMVWSAGVGEDTPHAVIANALKANPALWMALLPNDVCIVPRSALATVTGNNPHIVEHLAQMGANIVERRGYRLQEEEREREYERRWIE